MPEPGLILEKTANLLAFRTLEKRIFFGKVAGRNGALQNAGSFRAILQIAGITERLHTTVRDLTESRQSLVFFHFYLPAAHEKQQPFRFFLTKTRSPQSLPFVERTPCSLCLRG